MHKNPTGGKYMIFSPSVFIFSPLGHAIIVLLSQTVYWGGKYCKREIKSYFSRWTQSFFVTVSELSISTGGNYIIFFPPLSLFLPLCLYFSPCVFIFSLLGHAINCSTFAGGVLGENILCLCFPWSCCMVFILPFFLDSFLDMSLRRNNIIFSPLVQFFSYLWQKNL